VNTRKYLPDGGYPKLPPLRKTYRIERRLVEEHTLRLRRAFANYGGVPICPDCYRPHKTGELQCQDS